MNQAHRIAHYLLTRYSEWTAEELKPGQKFREPYLRWNDLNARAAYWIVCERNGLPREG
jgi:hypothetical protein